MMPLGSYLGFLAAATGLVLLPGPNVALIVGTSLEHGRRAGLITVAGAVAAMVVQLAAVGAGLAALMASASHVFAVLRWLGVAYLLALGLRAFLARPAVLEPRVAPRSSASAALRGFGVSITNPKTLLFYGAFLPQFIDPRGAADAQLLLLSATYLVVAATFDSGWALLATHLRGLLALRPRWRNRVTGTCLIGAAAGLALAHQKG